MDLSPSSMKTLGQTPSPTSSNALISSEAMRKESSQRLFLLRAARFCIDSPNANFVRHPAQRRAASRKLFRDDEAVHRIAGPGRGLLLHRQLPFDDVALRGG